MVYDAEKAHEYYEKYRKKGLKKGRKKGSRKTKKAKVPKVKKESLVGLGTSGLNEAGKMEWSAKKKELQEQMNAELQSATSDADKAEIRKKYQEKALETLTSIKSNMDYGDGKKHTSNGGLNDEGKMRWAMQKAEIQTAMNAELKNAVTDEDKQVIREKYQKQAQEIKDMLDKDARYNNPKKEKKSKTKKKKVSKSQTKQLKNLVKQLKTQLKNMTDEQKEKLKNSINALVEKLGG